MTDKPFGPALEKLLREHDLSQRELARKTEGRSKDRLSNVSISRLINGSMDPSLSAMERIATALAIRPEHFAEYRLEKRRDDLNWRKHGLKRALKALGE